MTDLDIDDLGCRTVSKIYLEIRRYILEILILEDIFGNFGYWKLLTILLAERWVRFRYWEIYFRDFCYWILENYLDIDDLTLMNFQNSEQVSFSRLHLPSTLPGGGCSPSDYVSHKDKQRQRYKQRKEHRERLRLPIFSISRWCVPVSRSCVTQRQRQRQQDTNKGNNEYRERQRLPLFSAPLGRINNQFGL